MKIPPRFMTVALLLLLPFVLTCGGDENSDNNDFSSGGSSSSGKTCEWHGNCSTKASNGAYDCVGNSVYQCINGQWESVVYCGALTNRASHGRSCTCKGGCGTRTVECSYAFDICGGNQFDQP